MSAKKPLQQTNGYEWNRAQDQPRFDGRDPDFIYEVDHPFGQLPNPTLPAPPQRKTAFQHQCDNALGKPWQAALLTHSDNFDPAPRPARATWNAPSAGVKARIMQDAALRATPEGQHILHLMAREDRANWFDSIKARLGRPVTAAESPKPKQNSTSARVISDSADTSDAGYFDRLRARLGKG